MASVTIQGLADIDYSLVDRRVTHFKLRDEVLFDEDDGVNRDGWRDRLWGLVLDQGLYIDGGIGLHAFIYPLLEEYLVGPMERLGR